jgi:hypothetical protein
MWPDYKGIIHIPAPPKKLSCWYRYVDNTWLWYGSVNKRVLLYLICSRRCGIGLHQCFHLSRIIEEHSEASNGTWTIQVAQLPSQLQCWMIHVSFKTECNEKLFTNTRLGLFQKRQLVRSTWVWRHPQTLRMWHPRYRVGTPQARGLVAGHGEM